MIPLKPNLSASWWVSKPLDVSKIIIAVPTDFAIILSVEIFTKNFLEGVVTNFTFLKKAVFL